MKAGFKKYNSIEDRYKAFITNNGLGERTMDILEEWMRERRANKFKDVSNIGLLGTMEKQRITMKYNVYEYLKSNQVDVRPDKNRGILHHKVFIVDNKTVITGSYNPTKAGNERNDENVLIIHDEEVALKFVDEFNSIM